MTLIEQAQKEILEAYDMCDDMDISNHLVKALKLLQEAK
tara:strand:- start:368 stop:484 length:117 start_codon:yes stop_codon:yes gene_type:complete